MPEIQPPVSLKCDGCNRYFDSEDDLALVQVGTAQHHFCRRCHTTATGPGWGRTFEQDQERDPARETRATASKAKK